MEYNRKVMTDCDVVDFWSYLGDVKKILFFNPQRNETIVVGKKCDDSSLKEQAPYRFSALPFTDHEPCGKWEGMSALEDIFCHYLVKAEQETLQYYIDEPLEMTTKTVKRTIPKYKILVDDYGDWKRLFYEIMHQINADNVEKVVASREVKVVFEDTVDANDMIRNLLKRNPGCFVYAFYHKDKVFLGATPEVLIEKCGSEVTSYAVAGTLRKDGAAKDNGKSLLLDGKNTMEHKIVIDEIKEVMEKLTDHVTIHDTKLLELSNLYHLKTKITAIDTSLRLDCWAKDLHPTPAMGGKPRNKALKIIENSEKHDRGLYASPLGMTDCKGDGVYVVGIRSALLFEKELYAYAGCGIVRESDCQQEYDETINKMQTILDCLENK